MGKGSNVNSVNYQSHSHLYQIRFVYSPRGKRDFSHFFVEKIILALEFFPDAIFLATIEEPTFQISTTLLEHGDARVVSRPATAPATLAALLHSVQGRLAKLES